MPKTPLGGAGYEFDVCLSFAGEDRAFVARVARCLDTRKVKYFYDTEQQADLWGSDLIAHLDDIYQHKSRYCMLFVSEHYKRKRWTNHERQSIQAREFVQTGYLLPVLLDEAQIPGLRLTKGHLDARVMTAAQIADKFLEKLVDGASTGRGTGKAPAAAGGAAAAAGKARSSATTGTPVKARVGGSRGAAAATPAPGNSRVATSGHWLLLGESFYRVQSLTEEGAGRGGGGHGANAATVTARIAPGSPREEADLRALAGQHTWERRELSYAYGNDAAHAQVDDVQVQSEKGKNTFVLRLKLERFQAPGFLDMTVNRMTPEEGAVKRARFLLLGEAPATGDDFQDSHVLRSLDRGVELRDRTLPRHWARLKAAGGEGLLQKLRLAALYELKASGIVEHVYSFELGPVTRGKMNVRFEGRRHRRYSNEEPATVSITGSCPIS